MKTRSRAILRRWAPLALPLLLLLPGAARADTLVDRGLTHRTLGAATLGYDPLGRVVVGNLGSSGQDGVAIDVPDGGRGAVARLDLSPGGLAVGQRRTVRMRAWGGYFDIRYDVCLEVGSGNSLLLTPDGSEVGATVVWVEVMNGDAAVLQRAVAHGTVVQVEGPPASSWARRGGMTPDRTHIAISQEGVKVVSDDHAQWIELRFAEVVSCDVQGTQAMGDAIRFVIRDALPVDRVTAVEFLGEEPGGGPGGMAIGEQGIPAEKKKGICDGLGGAHFGSSAYGGIAITNIGASGQDGVAIGPESADGRATAIAINVALVTGPAMPGAHLTVAVHGRAGAVEGRLGLVLFTPTEGTFQTMPDFSDVGAATYQLRVMQGASTVAELGGQSGGFGMPEGPFKFSTASGELGAVVGEAGGPTMFFNVGPAMYAGDRIEIIAETPPGPTLAAADYFLEIDVIAGAIAGFELLEVDVEPGVIPLADVSQVSARDRFTLGAPRPNPAGGAVALALALPAAGEVKAAVVDLGGRRVRDLGARPLGAGTHRLEWDGRDQAGRLAPAGVYFLSVATGGSTRSARVVRIR